MKYSETNIAFARLKQILKSRKITYRQLADKLSLSEPTVKRLFIEQDCKISRLIEICEVLNIELSDVLQKNKKLPIAKPLSKNAEELLATNPNLFYLFMLLLDERPVKEIQQMYNLSETMMWKYLRKLQSVDLIEIGPNNVIDFTISLPVNIKQCEKLQPLFIDLKSRFIKASLDKANHLHGDFKTASRAMRPESINILIKELNSLYDKFCLQAAEDQLLYDKDKLVTYKWLSVLCEINYSDLFTIK